MSLRPIDLQVLIPRATEVGKTQQLADKQIISQQQQFAEQWQQISTSRQQKVQSTPTVEGGKVQRDKEKNNNQRKNAQQGHQFSGKSSEHKEQGIKKVNRDVSEGTDPVRGHLIDIKT